MKYVVRIEQQLGIPLAVVCRRVSQSELAKVVPESCGIVWGVVRSQQLKGAGRHVAVYLDGQINVEVGVELGSPFPGYGEVVASTTPAGSVATATHVGPYGLLYNAHTAIQAWCRDHGKVLAGPSWEIYGHWQDEWNKNPNLIVTDICYLLAADPT